MMRASALREFADDHGLAMVSIADLIRYRRRYESQIERLFDSPKAMAAAVRAYAARMADMGRVPGGLAERYWVTTQA